MTIDLTPRIAERAAENAPAVVVYGTPGCSACRMTTNLMDRESITYTYVDASADEAAEAYVKAMIAQAFNGNNAMPVVVVDWPNSNMGQSRWQQFRPDLIKTIKAVTA